MSIVPSTSKADHDKSHCSISSSGFNAFELYFSTVSAKVIIIDNIREIAVGQINTRNKESLPVSKYPNIISGSEKQTV